MYHVLQWGVAIYIVRDSHLHGTHHIPTLLVMITKKRIAQTIGWLLAIHGRRRVGDRRVWISRPVQVIMGIVLRRKRSPSHGQSLCKYDETGYVLIQASSHLFLQSWQLTGGSEPPQKVTNTSSSEPILLPLGILSSIESFFIMTSSCESFSDSSVSPSWGLRPGLVVATSTLWGSVLWRKIWLSENLVWALAQWSRGKILALGTTCKGSWVRIPVGPFLPLPFYCCTFLELELASS